MTTGLGLDIATLAQTVFTAVQGKFTAAGIDLPDRRAIVGGAVEQNAWDCDCLLLGMSGIGLGPAPGLGGGSLRSGSPMSAMGVRHVVFAIQLVRCEPDAPQRGTRAPAVDVLTESGLVMMRDAGLMSQALVDVCADVALLAPGTTCEAGAVLPVGPDGGKVAVQGSIAVTAGVLA